MILLKSWFHPRKSAGARSVGGRCGNRGKMDAVNRERKHQMKKITKEDIGYLSGPMEGCPNNNTESFHNSMPRRLYPGAFRAWDPDEEKFCEEPLVIRPDGVWGRQWPNLFDDTSFCQMTVERWTGGFDKNKVPVYVGDLCRCGDGKHITEIRWHEFSFAGFIDGEWAGVLLDTSVMEVIGNIHEVNHAD